MSQHIKYGHHIDEVILKEREKYGNIIYSSMSEVPLGTISWAFHDF